MTSVVVCSAMPERRRDWARILAADGACVVQCSGPLVDCPLVRGETACRLLRAADLAVYDLDSITATFLPTLLRRHPDRTMLFARDSVSPGGQHAPSVRRVHFRRRAAAACFGDL